MLQVYNLIQGKIKFLVKKGNSPLNKVKAMFV